MPTYRQALEKLMSNPRKLKAWKKKHGEASLANFTKVSKQWNKDNPKKPTRKPVKSVSTIKARPGQKGLTLQQSANKGTDELRTRGEGVIADAEQPTSKNERKTRRNVERLQKIAKRGKNKEARLNRRADRIAARKGFEGSGKFLTNPDGTVVPDNEGLMKARGEARKLMAERKQKGKDFWRNFGSQMVRGTQAPPREGFQIKEGVADTAYGSKADTQEEKDASEKLNKDSIDAKFQKSTDNTNSNMAKNLFNLRGDLFTKDYTNWGKDLIDFGMGKRENNFQFTKLEEEDSTPQTAMNKIYKQKRGY